MTSYIIFLLISIAIIEFNQDIQQSLCKVGSLCEWLIITMNDNKL